jgi:hypothetical protein
MILIYVSGCERKEQFDSVAWAEGSRGFGYPHRSAMINDLTKRYGLIGWSKDSVVSLLGAPDFIEDQELVYNMVVDYGWDIDPVYVKNFVLTLNEDSTVLTTRTKEWRTGR